MSHVTRECGMSHMNESCLTWTSHVSHERVMSHMNESCLTWTRHVSYNQVMSHMNEAYLQRAKQSSNSLIPTNYLSHERVMSHINKACLTSTTHLQRAKHLSNSFSLTPTDYLSNTYRTAAFVTLSPCNSLSFFLSWVVNTQLTVKLGTLGVLWNTQLTQLYCKLGIRQHNWATLGPQESIWVMSHINKSCLSWTRHTSGGQNNWATLWPQESICHMNESCLIWTTHLQRAKQSSNSLTPTNYLSNTT